MKPAKIVVLAAAVLTILGVFALPYVSMGPISMTLWKLKGMAGKGESFPHTYIILATMLPAALIGGLAVKSQKFGRGMAIVTTLLFLIGVFIGWAVFSKIGSTFGESSGIGAKLMLFAMVAGLGASIVSIVKPDRGNA